MYKIDEDIARGLLSIKLAGFWTEEDVSRCFDELAKAAIRMGPRLERALVDCTEFKVQSPAVAARSQAAIASLEHLLARKVAMVVPVGLVRMQGQRVFTDPAKIHSFTTEEEALAWLLAPADPQARG